MPPQLPHNLIQKAKLRFALHHHHALRPQLIDSLCDPVSITVHPDHLPVQRSVVQLCHEIIKRNKCPGPSHASGAMHDSRILIFTGYGTFSGLLRSDFAQLNECGPVLALGNQEVGPAVEEVVPYRFGLSVGRELHFSNGGASTWVIVCLLEGHSEVKVVSCIGA